MLDNGGAAGANSALKFEADPNNGNKVPDANVNGVDYTNATSDYTVEYNAVTKTDENGNPVSVISIGNNQYTFVQPVDAPVKIRVTFTNGGGVVDKPVYNQCTKDANCPIHSFIDASTTAWYHDGIHCVLEEGIMVGTSATTFRPYDSTTRGTIATMLWRLMKSPVVNYNMTFGDVPAGTWYTEALAWANAKGLIIGTDANTLAPKARATRSETATIIMRFCEGIAK